MARSEPSRRDLFRLGGGAIALGSLASQSNAQCDATLVSGQVREHLTRAALPGVRVSNGSDIVVTDVAGRFEIPCKADDRVFIIKPSGWSTPVDAQTMLPRFHSSPDGSLDFYLTKNAEAEAFDVIMFADPQPGNLAELGFLRDQIAHGPIGTPAAFGITLGDLVGDDLSLFERYNHVISQIGLPWWNLPGNHDLDFSAKSASAARAQWRRIFGPTTYAFEYGAATFIMLDNINWSGKASGSSLYSGMIGRRNLAFVKSLLETTPADRLIVLCMHIPLVSANDPQDPASMTGDRDELLALLGDRPSVSFSGHMHTTEHHYLNLPNGGLHHHHVLTALSGSWWSGPIDALGQPVAQSCDGSPNGWHVLAIDGAAYSTRFVSSREPSQLRVMLACDAEADRAQDERRTPGVVARSALGDTKILANVFDGGPRTVVEACVSGCSPEIMSRCSRPDPLTQDLFRAAGATRKPWVRAEPSSHIWQADLPRDLRPGLHRLNVSVVNEYGRKHQGVLIFEVIEG